MRITAQTQRVLEKHLNNKSNSGIYYKILIPATTDHQYYSFLERAEKFFTALHSIMVAKFSIEIVLLQNRLTLYLWIENQSECDKFFHLLSVLYPSFNHQFLYRAMPVFYINTATHYYAKTLKITGSATAPFIMFENTFILSDMIFTLLSKINNPNIQILVQFLYNSVIPQYSTFTLLQSRPRDIENRIIKDQYRYKLESLESAFKTQFSVMVLAQHEQSLDVGPALLALLKTVYAPGYNRFSVRNISIKKLITHKFSSLRTSRQVLVPKELSHYLIYPSKFLEKIGLAYSYFSITNKEFLKNYYTKFYQINIGPSLIRNYKILTLDLNYFEGEHTAVFGETGYGKSTFLINAVLQLVQQNATVIFFDPVGTSVKDIIAKLPENVLERVVYIAPTESPIGINLLELDPVYNRDLTVSKLADDVIQTLRAVTESKSGIERGLVGSKIEDILKHMIIGLTDIPQATLIDIIYILNRESSRLLFKKLTTNVHALDFIEDYKNYTSFDLNSTRRLVNFIKTNDILRRMVCTRTPVFKFKSILTTKNIILINGERGKIGASASTFLLSAYLTKIWIAAQARKEKDKIIIFADEFHEYANSSLTDILATGRKENISLFLATTHTNLLSSKLFSGLVTNVKNLVLFRVSSEDAAKFDIHSQRDVDLTRLTKFVAFVKKAEITDLVHIERSAAFNNMHLKKIIAYNRRYITIDDSLPSIFLNYDVEYFDLLQNFLYLNVLHKTADFITLYNLMNFKYQQRSGEYIDRRDFATLLRNAIDRKLIYKNRNFTYILTDRGLQKLDTMIHGNKIVKQKIYRVFEYMTTLGFLCTLYNHKTQKFICFPHSGNSTHISTTSLNVKFYSSNTDTKSTRKFSHGENTVLVVDDELQAQNLTIPTELEPTIYILTLSSMSLEKYVEFKLKSRILGVVSDLIYEAYQKYKKKYTTITRISTYVLALFPQFSKSALKNVLEINAVLEPYVKLKLGKDNIRLMKINFQNVAKLRIREIDHAAFERIEKRVRINLLVDEQLN